ncbi:MAG: hypothetical protein WCS31_11665 [Verrucomicrobiae bacterium]
MEETIGKSVGRTFANEDPFVLHSRLLRVAGLLAVTTPYPRGVVRFWTHENADAWNWKHLIKAARKS